MTYFLNEIKRIKAERFNNQWQLDAVIGTRKYIEEQFDREINLELLADLQHISKYHLLRMYKRYYGQSPQQYLTEVRILRAKEFLAAGESVTETCFKVGFKSLGSFSTLFTSRVAMSPSQYRKRQLSRSFSAGE